MAVFDERTESRKEDSTATHTAQGPRKMVEEDFRGFQIIHKLVPLQCADSFITYSLRPHKFHL